MGQITNTKSPEVAQQESSKEHRFGLGNMESKPMHNGKSLIEDGALISNLGWISILSMTISGLSMIGMGAGL